VEVHHSLHVRAGDRWYWHAASRHSLDHIYQPDCGFHEGDCNARIQAVYDLKRMAFEAFAIDAYSKNDLKAAPEMEL